MRKSVLAIAAAGGVFALTGAAASTLIVEGPFNPRAGSNARACDLGNISVATQDNGTVITGFAVTSNIAADGQQCTGATVYVAIDNTAATALPAGWDGSADIGTAGDAADIRFSVGAELFTTEAQKKVTFEYAAAATHKIYKWTAPAGPVSVKTAYTLDPVTTPQTFSALSLGVASVLLTQSTPSTGAFLTPYARP